MRNNRRNIFYLALSFLSILGIIYLIFQTKPEQHLSLSFIHIEPLLLFLFLIFIFFSSLTSYIFKNLRRGILVGLFFASSFILRLYGFGQIFFLIMLAVLFFVVELIFNNRS